MTALPSRPFVGRDKWGHVGMYAALGAVGAAAAWAVLLIDGGSTFLLTLSIYTAVAAALTLALAAAFAATRQLPTLTESTFEGRPARGLHVLRAEWWHTNAVDLSLALGSFTLAALGIREGFDMRIPGIAVGVFGLWWLIRVLLTFTSRRNNNGFWLTDDELILESGEGRVRCPRAEVTGALARGKWSLAVGMKDGVTFERCPWPWRPRSSDLGWHIACVNLDMTAHNADDVADWLCHELGLEQPARHPLPGTDSTRTDEETTAHE
ncbi:hypothetical protein V6K52_00545 [Knoellia sp. S7-12]|uniref:hypothetical protein n=1 Tax=Knoellia sp. S7-12 TaxID=3126698 RepID=UPI0033694DE7